MNRELKFRAWDSITKKWLFGYEYPNLGGFSMKGEVMLFGEYSRFFESIPIEDWDKIILMQYTGLKDKNGKEIYEGDILMIPDYRKGIRITGKQPLKKQVMVYSNGFHGANFGGEVIGNIYENPELLNQ